MNRVLRFVDDNMVQVVWWGGGTLAAVISYILSGGR